MSIYEFEMLVAGGAIILFYVAAGLYLMTLQKALGLVLPQNRRMRPAFVWFNLIPVFGLFWHVNTVIRVSRSIKKEFNSRGITDKGDGGYYIGLIASISLCFKLSAYIGPDYFVASMLAILIGLVFTLAFWVIVFRYNRIMTKDLGLERTEQDSGNRTVSRVFMILDLVGASFMLFVMLFVVRKFMQIFKEMELDVPYKPLLCANPLIVISIFVLLVAALLIKERLIKNKNITIMINIVTGLLLILSLVVLVIAMFTPMFGLCPVS